MRIVVGLGNPGRRYARSRHNLGFLIVERLALRWRIALETERCGMRLGVGRVAGVATVLVEPQWFMNSSGEALAGLGLLNGADELIVIHDDVDLPVGQLRVRCNGGTGGHRGVASMVSQFGRSFVRVRVGIGRPPHGMPAVDYVLEPLTISEFRGLSPIIDRASDAVQCILAEGVDQSMNQYNVRLVN